MTPTPDKFEIPEAAVGPASRFRKKPVVIEAVQYEYPYMDMVAEFAGPSFPVSLGEKVDGGRELYITTLEDGIGGVAKHVASPGDWIIRGVKGEIYACKPDIFEATYEPASARRPHMPDRGYAEVGVKPLEWENWHPEAPQFNGHNHNRIAERAMHSFGAYFLEQNADDDCWWATKGLLGDEIAGPFEEDWQARVAVQVYHDNLTRALIAPPAPADNGKPPAGEDNSIDRQAPEAQRKQSDRNSPIEDVAGPSDAEIEEVARAIADADNEDYMEDYHRYEKYARAALAKVRS